MRRPLPGRGPLALVTLASFLASLSPVRRARADEPVEAASRVGTVATTNAGVHEVTATEEEPAAPRAPVTRVGRGVVPDSLPVDGTGKTGVSSQAIALPQGTGKIQGMGESFSTQLSTGVASFSVPIALPAARGGVQPSLGLAYSSGGGSGLAGMGWDVGVPYIARQTDRGVPRYADPPAGSGWQPTQDRFVFNGGQELIPICLVSGATCTGALPAEQMPAWACNWQYFRARVEGGFLRFFWSPDHQTWRVQSKDGATMELGAPLDGSGYTGALEEDPAGLGQIFRWNLVRQYDAYGTPNPACGAPPAPVNIVSYRYLQDGGLAYLSDIYDTPPAANASTAALASYAHHARLNYETRTDPVTSFRRGWQTLESLRLSGVDVTSATFDGGGPRQLVRRYHLAYDAAYHVSLLTRVQEEGRCATTEGGGGAVSEDGTGALPATTCPTLPPMTLGYSHVAGYTTAGSPQTSDLPGYEPFDERVIPLAASPPNSVDEDLTDLFDVNADGLPDVLVTNPGAYNGNFGVYFNSLGGQASTFAALATMPVTGVPGETAGVLTLNNLNVSAADIDGDGVIDLLHMPAVKTYSVYTPVGSGTSYSWVGRAITTASQQSPKIDFGDDAQNLQVMDVNGDGLVDVVYSSGTSLETFFSLGRYPNGDAQFGSAVWTGPASSAISNDPVQYCLPYAGLPVSFGDANTKIADMNGDGLPDIVYAQQGSIVYFPGRGNGYFGTGDAGACAAGSFEQNGGVVMAASPWYSDASGAEVRFDDVNGDGLDDIVEIGMNYVEVWLNVDGTSWTAEHVIQGTPPAPSYASRVRLTDINGSGTRDVLWGDAGAYQYIDLQGGTRPWVLTHVANGMGKTTDLAYASSTQQMLAAAAAGQPWASVTPMPVHVVTQVTENDNLALIGQPAGVYVTQYTYRDPVYDGRQREFRGFSSATSTRLGDANSPTSVTSETFLLGQCKNDEGETPDPCSEAGRWEDNPREALKGLTLVSETGDTVGNYLSTGHTTYRLRKLYTGLDGREVRYAFASQSDSYLYDTGPFVSGPQLQTLTDVELETTPGDVGPDTTEPVTLRATTGRAHLHTASTVDLFGNATAGEDDGCVDGCASGDEVITSHSVASLTPGDTSGWMYRTVEGYVDPGHLNDTLTEYDVGGNPVVVQAVLRGTLPLERFHEDPSALVAPPPSAQSVDGTILVSAHAYDALGQPIQHTAPNGRCRQIGHDAAYDQLATSEIIYVGPAPAPGQPPPTPCTGTALTALVPLFDRAFGLATKVVDIHQEVTTAAFDGFGRLASTTRPDPDHVGQASGAPSIIVSYCLPGDPAPCTVPSSAPYALMHTQAQDGAKASDATYVDGWAYVDGMGRTLATLDEADPGAGDGGQWVVRGFTSYDAKGAGQRAYLAWFWSGDPTAFPLSTVPTTAYSRQRYDAFGRAVQTFALDETQSGQRVYHAMTTDSWDAADLAPGPHQGTPASTTKDGHGRTASILERVHGAGGIETHETSTTYLPTGQPASITRVDDATGASVSRTVQYDSIGRMVLNDEPDTSSNGHAWRYAYDDNGDLVGTSDARGCGANFAYDIAGRVVAEDFSPCLRAQQVYSAPDLTTGDGTEAYYEYDALDADAPDSATFPVDGTLLLGRLVAVLDRGAKTITRYDGRGRSTGAARRLAAPGTPSDTIAARYAPHWYTQSVTFDGADRPVTATTGADVRALLDANDQSVVTTSYSQRGAVKSVSSGYGTLLASQVHDADGLVLQTVYGDVAGTTSTFNYDLKRRLSSVQTYRGPPALWSQQPAAYEPAPVTGAPSTLQLLLEDVSYQYDAVDNPVAIRDARNPAEWPAGAQPVTRQIAYDDLYRVTQIAYSYPAGSDTWVSPFDAEDRGVHADPRRAQPSPHVSFPQRVLAQSYGYDWLGNTTLTDDDAHAFYDRSAGTITNGAPAAGPYQLSAASASGSSGGSLTTAYDAAGNLVSMAVARRGPCLPAGASCSQRYAYDWDEVGRLARARRWDVASAGAASDPAPSATPDADLRYAYDANDNRTLKTAVDASGNALHTGYIFGSLELRCAAFEGGDFEQTAWTEVPYLGGVARLHYAQDDVPTASSGQLHVLLELADHLGSSSIVIDAATSELVERTSYLGYGSAESDYRPERWGSYREDHRFTGKEEDVECGIVYFGKRYLAPALGRWVSADPLTVHGLGADANAYAYVHGSLGAGSDPDGLDDPKSDGQGSIGPVGIALAFFVPMIARAAVQAAPSASARQGVNKESDALSGFLAWAPGQGQTDATETAPKPIVEAGPRGERWGINGYSGPVRDRYTKPYAILYAEQGNYDAAELAENYLCPTCHVLATGDPRQFSMQGYTQAWKQAYYQGFVEVPVRVGLANPVTGSWDIGVSITETIVGKSSGMHSANLVLGQVDTGRELSSGERAAQGISAAIGLVTMGAGIRAGAPLSETVQVTSWAERGVTPDLNPGRWVMLGGPSKWNFWKSGLPGGKYYFSSESPYFQWESSNVDPAHFITSEVPRDALRWPSGGEAWKGILGQRVMK